MKSLSGLVWFPDSAMAWSSHTGRPVWLGTRALEAHPPLPAYTAPPGTPRDGAHGGWQSSPFAQGLCAAEPFLQGQFQHLGSRLALVAPCPRTLWSQSLLAHFRILTPPGASQATGGRGRHKVVPRILDLPQMKEGGRTGIGPQAFVGGQWQLASLGRGPWQGHAVSTVHGEEVPEHCREARQCPSAWHSSWFGQWQEHRCEAWRGMKLTTEYVACFSLVSLYLNVYFWNSLLNMTFSKFDSHNVYSEFCANIFWLWAS